MACSRLRLTPAAAALVLFACWLGAASGKAGAQNRAYPSPPETISPDEPMDRMARFEARLRELETRNQQLQERYDDMARKYNSLLPKANPPPGGAEARNVDGIGVAGGFGLWSTSPHWFTRNTSDGDDPVGGEEEEQQDEERDVRRQSGAEGAGVRMGGGQRGPFGQPSRLSFRSGSEAATRPPPECNRELPDPACAWHRCRGTRWASMSRSAAPTFPT
jgi:hypothetical protein